MNAIGFVIFCCFLWATYECFGKIAFWLVLGILVMTGLVLSI